MEAIIVFGAIIAIIAGICNGLKNVNDCKINPSLGVKPSNSLIEFLFTDYDK
jgi:hypothetical protein